MKKKWEKNFAKFCEVFISQGLGHYLWMRGNAAMQTSRLSRELCFFIFSAIQQKKFYISLIFITFKIGFRRIIIIYKFCNIKFKLLFIFSAIQQKKFYISLIFNTFKIGFRRIIIIYKFCNVKFKLPCSFCFQQLKIKSILFSAIKN